jgi:enoyl-CoA hydratase/carnithine racemase
MALLWEVGCELAMSCHFRLASMNAKFGQPEVNLASFPVMVVRSD